MEDFGKMSLQELRRAAARWEQEWSKASARVRSLRQKGASEAAIQKAQTDVIVAQSNFNRARAAIAQVEAGKKVSEEVRHPRVDRPDVERGLLEHKGKKIDTRRLLVRLEVARTQCEEINTAYLDGEKPFFLDLTDKLFGDKGPGARGLIRDRWCRARKVLATEARRRKAASPAKYRAAAALAKPEIKHLQDVQTRLRDLNKDEAERLRKLCQGFFDLPRLVRGYFEPDFCAKIRREERRKKLLRTAAAAGAIVAIYAASQAA